MGCNDPEPCIEVAHFSQPPGAEALSDYLKREFPAVDTIQPMKLGFVVQAPTNNFVNWG